MLTTLREAGGGDILSTTCPRGRRCMAMQWRCAVAGRSVGMDVGVGVGGSSDIAACAGFVNHRGGCHATRLRRSRTQGGWHHRRVCSRGGVGCSWRRGFGWHGGGHRGTGRDAAYGRDWHRGCSGYSSGGIAASARLSTGVVHTLIHTHMHIHT